MAGPRIFGFAKFFEKEAYADDFIKGTLFMNRLFYFQNLENKVDQARPDRYEATAAWLQPASLEITFSSHPELNITDKDLAGPVSISFDVHKYLHLFCLCAIQMEDPASYGEIELHEAEERLRKSAELDARCCSEFGAYAVVMPAVPFIDRLKAAAQASGKNVQAGLVEYYDEKVFSGLFKFDEIPFRKQGAYSYQNEYRICIKTDVPGDDAMRFDLGESPFGKKLNRWNRL